MGLLKRDNIRHKIWLLVRRIFLKVPGAVLVYSCCGHGTEDASRREQSLGCARLWQFSWQESLGNQHSCKVAQMQPLKGLLSSSEELGCVV